MNNKLIKIALSSALLIFSANSQAEQPLSPSAQPSAKDNVAAPFNYARFVVSENSLDTKLKKQRIAEYVDKMPAQNFSRLVKAVGTERFIPKQGIFISKRAGAERPVPLSQQQRLENAMQSKTASKQLKHVLSQYLYADASQPVYAGLSGGMLATRMPVPSN